jgi:hypothetical protein
MLQLEGTSQDTDVTTFADPNPKATAAILVQRAVTSLVSGWQMHLIIRVGAQEHLLK